MSTSYYQTSVPSLLPTPLPTPLPTALPSLTFQPSFLDCEAGFGVFDGGGSACAACPAGRYASDNGCEACAGGSVPSGGACFPGTWAARSWTNPECCSDYRNWYETTDAEGTTTREPTEDIELISYRCVRMGAAGRLWGENCAHFGYVCQAPVLSAATACAACRSGTYAASGASTCAACPFGKYAAARATGATRPTRSPASLLGTYFAPETTANAGGSVLCGATSGGPSAAPTSSPPSSGRALLLGTAAVFLQVNVGGFLRRAAALNLPCGHQFLCNECADRFREENGAICNACRARRRRDVRSCLGDVAELVRDDGLRCPLHVGGCDGVVTVDVVERLVTRPVEDHVALRPYPRDTRCGCTFCSDCRPGRPCSQCNGGCVVCRGVVPPGPASADEIDAWAPGRFRDGDDAALADVDLGLGAGR
ncbi:hypothetical protein JL722_13823 [Aureococcus anophagefferens]|nr:hypothetical protein JL722_13823 [Aureococcus anophagefferens]